MRAILVFKWAQAKYTTLFGNWRNPQIEEAKSRYKTEKGEGFWQTRALRKLGERTEDVSLGVCTGISFFILKMLYSAEPFGGWDCARFFIREFQNPIIFHDGVSYRLNPLLESFSIALFLYDATTLDDTSKLTQVIERHNIWKNTLFHLIPELKSSGINTDLTIAAFLFLKSESIQIGMQGVRAEVGRLIDIILSLPLECPYSFWFFIEHLAKITSKRGILFPFVSEIMDIQKGQHRILQYFHKTNETLFKHIFHKDIKLEIARWNFGYDLGEISPEFLTEAISSQMRNWRSRKSHALSAPTPVVSQFSHDTPYHMHWFLDVGIGSSQNGHSLCFWEVEEKFLIRETGLIPRQTPVVRGFLFNSNIGLIEVEEMKDIDSFVAEEIYKIFGHSTTVVSLHFYDE